MYLKSACVHIHSVKSIVAPSCTVAPVYIYQIACPTEAILNLCGIQYVAAVRMKLLCDCSFAYFKHNIELYLLPAFSVREYFFPIGVLLGDIEGYVH